MMVGGHFIKGWSMTQVLVALSSGDAELYGGVKASTETLGHIAMMSDFNMKMRGHVFSDWSAAFGIIKRNGLGRTHHIQTAYLWVQDAAEIGHWNTTWYMGLRTVQTSRPNH